MAGKKQLAAILFSDIVGYSALMDSDQNKAFGNNSLGHVYLSLGDWDQAMHYYERAIENGEGQILWTKLWVKSFLRGSFHFSKDPRYRQILKRIGVPP